MAISEERLSDLINRLSTKSPEDTQFKWTSEPLEIPTYNISSGGTSDSMYGAVPNVTIGSNIISTSATGINVSSPVWTTSGTGTSYTIGTPNVTPMTVGSRGTVSLKGEDADIDINGKSLKTWMEKVEERLNILTPNPEMEKEWDDLRRLGEKYRRLEKKCKEKSDMWNKLKAMPKPDLP